MIFFFAFLDKLAILSSFEELGNMTFPFLYFFKRKSSLSHLLFLHPLLMSEDMHCHMVRPEET